MLGYRILRQLESPSTDNRYGTCLSLALWDVSMQSASIEGLQVGRHLIGILLGVCEDDGSSHGTIIAHAVSCDAGSLCPVAGQHQMPHTSGSLQRFKLDCEFCAHKHWELLLMGNES